MVRHSRLSRSKLLDSQSACERIRTGTGLARHLHQSAIRVCNLYYPTLPPGFFAMNRTAYLTPSLIRVEKIALNGPGVVILTGPSSCGKGEVASALCELLSIDPDRHLSMGVILRTTVERARDNDDYASLLAERYSLSQSCLLYTSPSPRDRG